MVKDLFKRSGSYAFFLFIGRGLTLILFIILARILQPKGFGEAVLFVTLSQLFTTFADFGLNQWYMKQADLQDKNRLFNQIVGARLFTLFVSIFICIIFLALTKTFNLYLSFLLIICLIPEAFLSVVDGYYFEKKQSYIVAFKPIIRNGFILGGMFIFYKTLTLTVDVVISIYLISTILNLLIIFPWKILSLKFVGQLSSIFHTLKKSSSYALLIFTSYFYARGDHLIIKYLLNSYFLGIYSAAYRYLEALSLVPMSLTHNLFPIAAQKKSVDQNTLIKITLIMAFLGVFAGGILYFSADFLIVNLVGASYQAAVAPLKIFALVIFMFFVNAPLASVVQSSDLIKRFLPFGIANTIFNLLLNIAFVPFWGITAAAGIMFITEFTGFVINVYFAKLLYARS